MKLNKWNYSTHKYDPYDVPDGLTFKTYSDDMAEIVNCPHCFKEIHFGEGYTSLEVHTPLFGFGYAVCADCHREELERRMEEDR